MANRRARTPGGIGAEAEIDTGDESRLTASSLRLPRFLRNAAKLHRQLHVGGTTKYNAIAPAPNSPYRRRRVAPNQDFRPSRTHRWRTNRSCTGIEGFTRPDMLHCRELLFKASPALVERNRCNTEIVLSRSNSET